MRRYLANLYSIGCVLNITSAVLAAYNGTWGLVVTGASVALFCGWRATVHGGRR